MPYKIDFNYSEATIQNRQIFEDWSDIGSNGRNSK